MELIDHVFETAMRVPPSRRTRMLLRELPLRLEQMTPENIKSLSETSVEILERLDLLNLGGEALTIVQRARRVLRNAEEFLNAKSFALLQSRASEALAKFYSNNSHPALAAWHGAISEKTANLTLLREINVNHDEAVKILNEARTLLFEGEPYLAWQLLSAQGFDQLSVIEREALAHLRFFCFGLISTTQEIKTALRARGTDRFPMSAKSRVYGFAILLARGDTEWTKDRALKKLFLESAREHGPFSSLLNNLVRSLLENPTRHSALEALEEFWVGSELLTAPEERALALGILGSRLRFWRAPKLLRMVEPRLEELSLKMSNGELKNLWNLTDAEQISSSVQKRSGAPPTSFAGRLAAGMSLSFSLTKNLGPRRMSQLLGGRIGLHQLTEKETEMILDLVAAYLSRLKGPMMKLGQTVSYAQLGLPALFADRLQGLQSQSEPMSADDILEEIPDWRDWLKEFDPQPVGVGSIGQVHRGRLKRGEEVAIKVQFPQIERAVHSDFRILRSLLRVFSVKAPNLPLNQYLSELEHRILMECDFEQEARAIERFRSRHSHHPGILIPKVYSHLCRRQILVTEFMRGKKLNEAAQASKGERDRWGSSLVDFVVGSCRDGDFNTDPHPGNFLFHNDQLVCLDFGSTYQMSPRFSQAWNYMIQSCTNNDIALYQKALDLTGMRERMTNAEIEAGFRDLIYLVPGSWTFPVVQPLDPKVISGQVQALSGGGERTPVPSEFIFGLRVYIGHLSVVAALGAENNWNKQVKGIMGRLAPPHSAL